MKIYLIENQINRKKYVGQTIGTIKNRWIHHVSDSKNTIRPKKYNYPLYRAFRKYGLENFTIKEIDKAKTFEELDEKEIYWIKSYKCFSKFGYNLTEGGHGTRGRIYSLETREKLRKAQTGKRASAATKEKQRLRMMGNQHSKGKTHKLTEETKQKMRKPKSLKHRIHISEAQKILAKKTKRFVGENNPMCNKVSRNKVAQSKVGRKIIIMSDGTRKLSPRINNDCC